MSLYTDNDIPSIYRGPVQSWAFSRILIPKETDTDQFWNKTKYFRLRRYDSKFIALIANEKTAWKPLKDCFKTLWWLLEDISQNYSNWEL